MKADELYEALRGRARKLSKTIHEYLGPKMNLPDIGRAKELLATLQVMDQVKVEVETEKRSRKDKP